MTSPSSPSSCSGFRTSTTSAPSCRSTAACSRKAPCTASTPILMRGILRRGLVHPVARRQPEQDEEKADDAEDERQHPLPDGLPCALRLEQRARRNVRPLPGEVGGRG